MRLGKFHYGWTVTLACGIMLFANLGLTMNCFSLFLAPLIDTAGLTKTEGSTVTSFQSLGSILSMLACSPLFRRFGARRVSFVAGLVIAAGFASFAFAQSMWSCCASAFLTGMGYGTGSMIPVAILLTSWFEEKRGFALGLAGSGAGIATIVFPPVLAGIIARNGIAAGFLCQAAIIAVLVTLAFILIRDVPSDKGLAPYGAKEGEHGGRPSRDGANVTLFQALRGRAFYLMAAVQVLLGGTVTATMQHFSSFYTSEGHPPPFAALMLSIAGLVMLFSKPLYGWIMDRFGIPASNSFILSIWFAAMAAGLFIGGPVVFAYLFAILFGIGMSMGSGGLPIWSSALFGKANMASFFSIFRLFYALGGFLGMVLPGMIADRTGRYVNVFYVYMGVAVLTYCILQYAFLHRRNAP